MGQFSVAEREGFEPSRGFWPPTGLANPPLQPLGYLSVLAHGNSLQSPNQA